MKITLTFFVLLTFKFQLSAAVLDSLRMESHNGRNFVIHKVTKGQTLLSTLRKYGCSMNDFKAENPGVDVNINVDQKLRIPYNREISIEPKIVTSKKHSSVESAGEKVITVQPGMTLFSIAKKYNLTLEELKNLNALSSNVAKLGDKLIVKAGSNHSIEKAADVPVLSSRSETAPANANKIVVREVPAVANRKTEEALPNEENKIKVTSVETAAKPKVVAELPKSEKVVEVKPKPVASELPKVEDKKAALPKEVPTVSAMEEDNGIRDKKVEEGIAEFISVESNSGKYLALHKTAPSGTLIQVKNETNGASVWVKVIGKLPEVDQNENIIIKLSPKAFNRVSPVDRKFRAKLSYIVSR